MGLANTIDCALPLDKSIVLSEQKRNGESGYKTNTITSVEYENNANSK